MAMDLRSLEHFVTIAETGGFAEASRKLSVSQPTLSRSIAQLEDSLRAKLFSRGARGTVITESGRRLLPHALSILAETRRAQELFEDDEPALEQFVIDVSPNFLHIGFPGALRQMLADQPGCAAIVNTATVEAALENVTSRKSDVALCLIPTHTHYNPGVSALQFEELGSETLVPVARADHPAFGDDPSLETLSRHEWAVPYQLSVSYRFETAFFRRNMPVPRQRLHCTSLTLLRHAIDDCGLIALMPRSLIAGDVRAGRLREFDIAELRFDYVVLMAFVKLSPRDRRSNMVKVLADTIRAAVGAAMR